MATIALGFNISASATGMAQGVNAAAVELEKLGYAAKKTAADVGVLKTLSIGRAFVDGISSISSTFSNYASGVIQATESTSNLSRELGISYEELTAIQLAAQLSGASAESLGKAFTKAQVTITKAAAGGKEAVQALSAIGLSAADFQGLSSSEQFTLIANAINGITDPAQRAAAAVAIFGRSGAELLPVFRELGGNLAQAQELLTQFNGGVSAAQAEQVNAIGDAFDKVGAAIQIVATQALAALSPALTQASNEFITFLASLDIAAVADTAAAAIQAVAGGLQIAYSVASVLSPIMGALGKFIQFIGDNSQGAAIGLGVAAGALVAYQVAAVASTIATTGLGVAIRSLLASTGIGALVVGLGLLAGAAIEYAVSSKSAEQAAGTSTASIEQQTKAATAESKRLAAETAATIKQSFGAAEDAASKAATEAKRAADSARREADSSIQRLVTEQQFGGDSQRYSAAQAVLAIQADIKRTEEEIAAAREAGDQDALAAGTRRLAQLDQAMAREEEIASGARKAAEQRIKLESDYAKARQAFDERRLAALARPSTELLKLEDTRTASGYEALQRFSQDQSQDPALEEYRKQLRELQRIRAAIENNAAPADVVDIIGA